MQHFSRRRGAMPSISKVPTEYSTVVWSEFTCHRDHRWLTWVLLYALEKVCGIAAAGRNSWVAALGIALDRVKGASSTSIYLAAEPTKNSLVMPSPTTSGDSAIEKGRKGRPSFPVAANRGFPLELKGRVSRCRVDSFLWGPPQFSPPVTNPLSLCPPSHYPAL